MEMMLGFLVSDRSQKGVSENAVSSRRMNFILPKKRRKTGTAS
jgi:hypothetical protein